MYKVQQCSIFRAVIFVALSIVFITLALLPSIDLFKYHSSVQVPHYEKIKSEIGCYEDINLASLDDVSDMPRPDKNSIFFHETSCKSYNQGRIVIDVRQACAVESAAVTHPNRSIYLLYTSPGLIFSDYGERSDLILAALKSYNNVRILHANYRRYISNTPVEHLYTTGKIKNSNYPLVHASDIMRYLTLYKYGGVYLDLDVLMIKTLDDLGPNFSGMETDSSVAAGLIGISSSEPGHTWAESCLKDLSKNFKGWYWSDSSVGVMTRLVQKLCQVEQIKAVNQIMDCQGFKVTPSKSFYPVPYWVWNNYFDPTQTERTLYAVKESYAIHLWNKLSHNKTAVMGSAYEILAKKFCPKVFAANGGQVI